MIIALIRMNLMAITMDTLFLAWLPAVGRHNPGLWILALGCGVRLAVFSVYCLPTLPWPWWLPASSSLL